MYASKENNVFFMAFKLSVRLVFRKRAMLIGS